MPARHLRLVALVTLLAAGTAWAVSNPAGLPPGGISILRNPIFHHELQSDPSNGYVVVVKKAGPGGEDALELCSHVEGDDWDAQFYVRPSAPVQKGDALLLTFQARTIAAPAIAGGSYVKISFEFPNFWELTDLEQPAHAPFLRSLMLSASPEWQSYTLPAIASRDMSTNDYWVALRAGKQPQTVQFSDLRLLHFGPGYTLADLPASRITYPGREPGAAWRTAADERINTHRKRPLTLTVVDARQQPVSGAQVSIELARHAFEFGVAFDAPRVLERFHPQWQETRQAITSNFTGASFVNELKWQAWAGDWPEDRYRREVALEALAWVHEAGLPMRGHALVWPRRSSTPQALHALLDASPPDCAGIQNAIAKHMDEVGRATSFAIREWDLLNEPIPCRDIQTACGDQVMTEWFQLGRKWMPGVRLAINEYGIIETVTDGKKVGQFETLIQSLLQAGAPIDVLGLQGHFKAAEGIPSPERMLHLLNRFAAFGLTLRATEFDVASEDEDLIRDVYRDFYTIMFSHPAVAGLQVWEWSEIFREDGQLTPAGQIHRELLFQRWHTAEQGVTDGRGRFTAQGFKGDYRIAVRVQDKVVHEGMFTLGDASGEATITLPMP